MEIRTESPCATAPNQGEGGKSANFWTREASLIATTVVLVLVLGGVVSRFRKMPKALLIRNGKLRNLAYTFVASFPTDLSS